MSVVNSFRLPVSAIAAVALLTLPVYAKAPVTPSAVNNIEVATPETTPEPSQATEAALEAAPANKDLSNFDPAPFKGDIDEIATLQRKNRILKLRVETADLERELAEARTGKKETTENSETAASSAALQTQIAPTVRTPGNPEWSVSSIQGVGSTMTAVLIDPSGMNMPVRVGSLLPGGSRVASIGETGVTVRRSSGSVAVLPFAGQ